jgi:hypothetical protein
MQVKKGQLRLWNQNIPLYGGRTFLTVSSRIMRDRKRDELCWGGRDRGEILWTILGHGNLVEEVTQMTIHANSEVISEAG